MTASIPRLDTVGNVISCVGIITVDSADCIGTIVGMNANTTRVTENRRERRARCRYVEQGGVSNLCRYLHLMHGRFDRRFNRMFGQRSVA